MKRAVVLGSGGGVGGGWEVGVLKGLTEAGIDVAEAELFVGSSVGATICAQVRAFGVQHAYEARLAGPGMPRPDQNDEDREYYRACMRMWGLARQDVAVRIELGRKAVEAIHTLPQDAQVAAKRRLGIEDWPDEQLMIVAVDVKDGSVRFFDRSQGVPLELALAATSAQPGLQAPVAIDGRRYMDGGIAGTNINGAAGCELVLAILPFPARLKTPEEIAIVGSAGGRAVAIAPDDISREAIGPNASDSIRVPFAAEAGIRQGRTQAAGLTELWRHCE